MDKKLIVIIFLFALVPSGPSFASDQAIDSVLVKKSERKMYLVANGKPVREYRVAFGANPKGHKQMQGDERTPEGTYTLDYKNGKSSFYKAIHISYPNTRDIARARAAGVDPGGQIMIHGQHNGLGQVARVSQKFNWTDGCIAVTNQEMDEIWDLVDVGTPIEITP